MLLSFVTTHTNLKDIILREIRRAQKDKYNILLLCIPNGLMDVGSVTVITRG